MKSYLTASNKFTLKFYKEIPDSFVASNRTGLGQILPYIKPHYIFFPFWSWIIPPEIYEKYECIAFHMTDLPFGRGGSPLQNLIADGYTETMITAFRVTGKIDAGAIYMKRPLSLLGSAEEIYLRASDIIVEMIKDIIKNEPTPREQQGEATYYKRRTPEQSLIPHTGDLNEMYDYIRMLDVDGYPHAFFHRDKMRYEFTRASLRDGYIQADVRITCE